MKNLTARNLHTLLTLTLMILAVLIVAINRTAAAVVLAMIAAVLCTAYAVYAAKDFKNDTYIHFNAADLSHREVVHA